MQQREGDMARAVAGVIAGAVTWLAGFFAQMIVMAAIWRDVVEPGRIWANEGRFTFTTSMACFMLLFWALSATAAGWVAMKIAKRREAVWVLSGLIGLLAFTLHIALGWEVMPAWYNLGVVIPIVPAFLLGGKLADRAPAAATVAV
jgi:hypothetical protein